jgi:hypothetical protein
MVRVVHNLECHRRPSWILYEPHIRIYFKMFKSTLFRGSENHKMAHLVKPCCLDILFYFRFIGLLQFQAGIRVHHLSEICDELSNGWRNFSSFNDKAFWSLSKQIFVILLLFMGSIFFLIKFKGISLLFFHLFSA